MRLHRFYVQQPLGEELVIENKEQVHQWFSVFRLKEGDSVLLFSSLNPLYDYLYRITASSKKRVGLSFVEKKKNILPLRKAVLYVALVKREAFETILRQATEMLITDIVPVLSDRSEKKSLNHERAQAILIEASEQCGRGDAPTLHEIEPFSEAVTQGDPLHVICDTKGEHSYKPEKRHEYKALWIGPEGGWSDSELVSFEKQEVTFLHFGKSILRADTAAVVGITTVFL